MALNITSELVTLDGIALSTSYGRIEVRDSVSGDNLICALAVYASKPAFEAGRGALVVEDPAIDVLAPLKTYWVMPYSRETDGTDILVLAHDYIQGELSNLGVQSTIVL